MQRYFDTVQDINGRAVAGATVTVYTSGVVNPLPVIYQTSGSKTAPAVQTNPITTDSLGNYSFAAPDGTYDIVISGGGIPTKTLPNLNFFDGGITYPSPQLGTVTSVSFTAPVQFSVGGSPVTGSGTLALTWANQTSNTILAGPTSGGAAAPTYRALVAADLPTAGTAGTKGSATKVPVFVTDAYGRVTSNVDTTITPAWGSVTGTPTTLAGYGISDGASIAVSNNWTAGQHVARVSLSGTSVTPNLALSNVFYLSVTGNTTLNNPLNPVSGASFTLIVKQAGAGGYTFSYGTKFKWPSGTVQQPDATLGAVSALFCQYDIDNDIYLCNWVKKYS